MKNPLQYVKAEFTDLSVERLTKAVEATGHAWVSEDCMKLIQVQVLCDTHGYIYQRLLNSSLFRISKPVPIEEQIESMEPFEELLPLDDLDLPPEIARRFEEPL